ncbi:transglycosylase SLT domain-containing protein [Cryptococcus wingfieldii CBS 7118]|uniref:Transglycosylase SLT domain-containing protein n=1 Tax=Cryptococcus wingfieldii CBS 7118 TaxID=1295528 RepID=A0A1E3K5V2_9TREE|nr:transglycosylase SLT domain-containing protein [Cryptococcus wingfieldii CBS 7118]ODO08558.1 transglycosylase SLT domain-containing protein [Cryptococcus wingfieldii CBS 7118]
MLANSLPLLTALLPLVALVDAGSAQPPHLRHRRMANSLRTVEHPGARAVAPEGRDTAHANAKRAIKKNMKKRGNTCRPRDSASASASSTEAAQVAAANTDSTDSWSSSASQTESAAAEPTWSAPATLNNNEALAPQAESSSSSASWSSSSSDAWSSSAASTSSSSAAPSSSSSSSSIVAGLSGLLQITDSTCGYSNADSDSPNGSEDWLNCGLTGAGWTPPMVTVDDLIAVELSADGTFSACADYIDKFNTYGAQYNVKPVMLASFAMQESTCNPSITGGNGEAGLMQLTAANCEGAPDGNCYDVDFNIQRATKLFADLISSNGGNVLLAIGSYNGWYSGLTQAAGTAAASTGQCSAQNNLDYLHQFCNGWMQGKSGYNLGTYLNLASC